MSPPMRGRTVRVYSISDGIAILDAIGEGKLLVSTNKRQSSEGYFDMAEATIAELRGKTQDEIFELLDKRMDKILEKLRR